MAGHCYSGAGALKNDLDPAILIAALGAVVCTHRDRDMLFAL
jgi:hypothetical protein